MGSLGICWLKIKQSLESNKNVRNECVRIKGITMIALSGMRSRVKLCFDSKPVSNDFADCMVK